MGIIGFLLTSSIPLLATPVARAQPAGPINLVGYGDCGKAVLRLLDQHGLLQGDHATLHDRRPATGLNLSEPLRSGSEPHRGRPIVAIAGGGGRGNNNTLRTALDYAHTWGAELNAVVFLPFAWEGTYRRTRGLSLAAQFGLACTRIATIDNEAVATEVLGDEDEVSLLECYQRANVHVLPKVSRFLATVRLLA